MVIVLAVSRDWRVFHVDGMWTSTRGSGSCGRGVKNLIFLWTS